MKLLKLASYSASLSELMGLVAFGVQQVLQTLFHKEAVVTLYVLGTSAQLQVLRNGKLLIFLFFLIIIFDLYHLT